MTSYTFVILMTDSCVSFEIVSSSYQISFAVCWSYGNNADNVCACVSPAKPRPLSPSPAP